MGAAIIKIILLLAILILPLSGRVRRKKDDTYEKTKTEFYSKYSVNEEGDLEITQKGDREQS
jgi:hypothetical protein